MKSLVCSSPTHCTPARVSPAARLVSLALALVLLGASAPGADFAQVLERIDPLAVGAGSFLTKSSRSVQFVGTGFAVVDDQYIITNSHAVVN